jgi:hypothetical protein
LNPAAQKKETETVITVYKRLYTEKVGALILEVGILFEPVLELTVNP